MMKEADMSDVTNPQTIDELFEGMFARADAEAKRIEAGGARRPSCQCGTDNFSEEMVQETHPYGDADRTFKVKVPVMKCHDCGRSNVDDRAEKLRDEAFLKEPEEFRRRG
jgi:hypothetical protein